MAINLENGVCERCENRLRVVFIDEKGWLCSECLFDSVADDTLSLRGATCEACFDNSATLCEGCAGGTCYDCGASENDTTLRCSSCANEELECYECGAPASVISCDDHSVAMCEEWGCEDAADVQMCSYHYTNGECSSCGEECDGDSYRVCASCFDNAALASSGQVTLKLVAAEPYTTTDAVSIDVNGVVTTKDGITINWK